MQNAISFMPEFPKLNGVGTYFDVDQSPMLPLTGARRRWYEVSSLTVTPVDPKAAQGQFLSTVVEDPPMMGTGSGYMIFALPLQCANSKP